MDILVQGQPDEIPERICGILRQRLAVRLVSDNGLLHGCGQPREEHDARDVGRQDMVFHPIRHGHGVR